MQFVKFVIGASLLWCITCCASLLERPDPPGVAVTSLHVGRADGLNQTFVIGLTLTNPNRTELDIQGMSYSLALNGYELLQGVKGDIPIVAPYGEVKLELTANTNLINALRFINDFIKQGAANDLDYKLEAKLDLGGMLGKVSVVEKGTVANVSGLDSLAN